MTDRDGPLCRTKARLAIRVEALQHFRGCKLGQHVAGLLIEAQASLIDELHAGGRRDRLGHRQEPEHRVCCHRRALVDVALPDAPSKAMPFGVAPMATTPATSPSATARCNALSTAPNRAGVANAGFSPAASRNLPPASAAPPVSTARRVMSFINYPSLYRSR